MRKIIIMIATLLMMQASAVSASDGQMTLVVGFAAGGTSSTAARIIAESVENITGSTVLVENRPGAGGAIAAESVQRQRESNTLLFMSSTSSLKVAADKGLVPIGVLATYSYVVVAGKNSPATLVSYMDAASTTDALRNVATAGAGSIPHLIGVRLFEQNGVPVVHVPYQGSSPAILSVVSGHVALAIVPFPDFIGFQDALRIIAQTGNGISAEGWIGVFASPGTTTQEVARLSDIFQRASMRAKDRLAGFGFRQVWKPGTELRAAHEHDRAVWMPVLERLGIQP